METWAIVLIVVIVVALVIAAYFYYQSQKTKGIFATIEAIGPALLELV